jgi:hypothetical protein
MTANTREVSEPELRAMHCDELCVSTRAAEKS